MTQGASPSGMDGYNLVERAWIPVLKVDGTYGQGGPVPGAFKRCQDGISKPRGGCGRVGIRAALTEAGRIRQIAASNPMDNVALLRFLLAVLQWCKPNPTDKERNRLNGAEGIPPEWLSNLGIVAKPNEAFNLLGDDRRFLQDKQLLADLLRDKQKQWDNREKKKTKKAAGSRQGNPVRATTNERPKALDEDDYRPVGDLLVEFPTDTKIAHFRHVRDKEYGLCPACCALGIVRFCAFANAYGGGRYTSAANGPTPAYAIAWGATLLDTLRLHWPARCTSPRQPPWLCAAAPSKDDLDIVTVFAWRSRRLWLGDPGDESTCAYCGQPAALIRQLAFTGNWKPPFETAGQQKKFWDKDPHLVLIDKSQAAGEEEESGNSNQEQSATAPKTKKSAVVKTTLGFPSPSARVTGHSRFWRRVLSAKATEQADADGTPATLMVAGPAANKGLYQDAAALHLRVPVVGAAQTLEAQGKAVEAVSGVLRQSTPNPDRQHPNRIAVLDALSPSLEADLRRDLDRSLGTNPPGRLIDALGERLAPVVERVVRSTTPGSPLRRREAMARARSALDAALHKATTPLSKASSRKDAAKPERTRKKKEATS
ncbi:MAG: type I-E CRISPR-associated protein Cse1/CasA [Nitrospirae bacterium]|nr:type I-E CRISPR-associated protein Cse1/CasA [Nitrospirota bacterium]